MDTLKNNKQLQVAVREELKREHTVDADAIGITVDHSLVFLSGHVLGVTQRRTAEEAALRVDGVRAVIDELKIRPGRWGAHDADLACLVTDSLNQLIGLPDGRVKFVVREGKVRLKGAVSQSDEKEAIASNVRRAIGHDRSLDNAIVIQPEASPWLLTNAPTPPILATSRASEPFETEPEVEVPSPGQNTMIVVDESFTDEGIPMTFVHHSEFPEIRGEGETVTQGTAHLARHLDLAREHARESWQRVAIDQAIRDVRAYHSRLQARSEGDSAPVLPDEISRRLSQVAKASMSMAIH